MILECVRWPETLQDVFTALYLPCSVEFIYLCSIYGALHRKPEPDLRRLQERSNRHIQHTCKYVSYSEDVEQVQTGSVLILQRSHTILILFMLALNLQVSFSLGQFLWFGLVYGSLVLARFGVWLHALPPSVKVQRCTPPVHTYSKCHIELQACSQVAFLFLCALFRPPRSVSGTPIRVAGISQRKSWQGEQGAGIQHLLLATPLLPLHPHRYVSCTILLISVPTARLHERASEAFRTSD